MIIHVVRKGEVLWQIAEYYQADIKDIIEINEIANPNLLLEGQALLIPMQDVVYTVKYGDTLWSIAQRFHVPLEELLSLNRIINPNMIYPGVVLTLPQERKPPIEVNAFTYVFGPNDIAILNNIVDYLTYLTPFSYVVNEDGRIFDINDNHAVQFSISNNVIPVMSVANYTFNDLGTDTAHIILNDLDVINNLLDNIIYTLRTKNYRGVKFNFENILPEDKEAYNNFLQVASSRLDSEGFFLASALMPKYSDEHEGLAYDAHDYEAHGMIVDYIVLMIYKWGLMEEPPGPIAPINNIRSVMDYTISAIAREKIFIGLHLFAKDWVLPHREGQQAQTISIEEAMNRAQRHRAKIHYDGESHAPYYNYVDEQGRMHEVWFEDARSMKAKFDLIKEYGIRGITYWALGYPFPQNWHLLEDNFLIIKD